MKLLEYQKRQNCAGCGVVFTGGPIGEGIAKVAALAKRGIRAVDIGDVIPYGAFYCPLCETNIFDALEVEWAETCRKCGKVFEDKYEHLHVRRFWNKTSERYDWQCQICSRPKRGAR